MDLNHLHLHTKNIDNARKFYEKHFNFKEHALHGNILFLRNENCFDLALMPDEKEWKFPDWFHFGFRLGSPEEVGELYLKLKISGENIDTELEKYDDFVFFRCLDPDNNRIEVYWE